MNLKFLFALLFSVLSIQAVLLGQIPKDSTTSISPSPNVDSSGKWISSPLYCLDIPHTGVVIDNIPDFKACQKDCNLFLQQPNFETHVLLACTYGGDCKMTVEGEVLVDKEAKTITLLATNYWGRCRAGGWRTLVVVIEKPAPDYQVLFREVQTDEPWRREKELLD